MEASGNRFAGTRVSGHWFGVRRGAIMTTKTYTAGSRVAGGNSVTAYKRYTRARENTYGKTCYPLLPATERPPTAQIWRLDFQADGDGPPVELRIRRLLKSALRRFGLKCVDYAQFRPSAVHTPETSSGQFRGAGRTVGVDHTTICRAAGASADILIAGAGGGKPTTLAETPSCEPVAGDGQTPAEIGGAR